MSQGHPVDRSLWPARGAYRQLVAFLDRVHAQNGTKSLRVIASRMSISSPTRISAMLRGVNGTLPADLPQLEELIRALGGGDDEVFRGRMLYQKALQARHEVVISKGVTATEPPSATVPRGQLSEGEEGTDTNLAGESVGRVISELTDPFALEVHRSIDAGVSAHGLPVLPIYVEREHDAQLRNAVQHAVNGNSAIVVLVGDSSTGKTRACWEAVHSPPLAGWRLWHPLDPGRPQAAADTLARIAPYTIVWLNEIQHYLITPAVGLGERIAAGLRELLRTPERGPVLILGTIWPEPWNTLTAAPGPGEADPHAQARALLTGTSISIPLTFSGPALDAVGVAAEADPRLAEAYAHAQGGQITQYLAGVPVLLERYRTAPAPARALITAALDARRLGHGLRLPRALLEVAMSGYLTDQHWDALIEDSLDQAFADAAAPCQGARGPLTRVRPRPGDPAFGQLFYRLADHLEQSSRTIRHGIVPPAALWDALVEHGDRASLRLIAENAKDRGLYRHAARLYTAAAGAGDPFALRCLGDLLRATDRGQDALSVYRRAAECGDSYALSSAVQLMAGEDWRVSTFPRKIDAESARKAISWVESVANLEDAPALEIMADLMERAERHQEAVTYYERAAEAREHEANHATKTERERGHARLSLKLAGHNLCNAAKELEKRGCTEEAIACYKRAAEAGNDFSVSKAAELLTEKGGIVCVISWLQTLADDGNETAFIDLTYWLKRAGQIEEGVAWLKSRAESGDPFALERAAELLAWAGQVEEAITLYQQAAEAGCFYAFEPAARLMDGAGRTEEAIAWLKSRAGAGDPYALIPAAQLLMKLGRNEEAITICQRAAEADVRYSPRSGFEPLKETAGLLTKLGRVEEAITWLKSRAEGRDWSAQRLTVELLTKAGRVEEAITWLKSCAEGGDRSALDLTAELLTKLDRAEEAITWLKSCAESDDSSYIMDKVAVHLGKAGRVDDAVTVYKSVALTAADQHVRAISEASYELKCAARLLEEADRTDDAVQLTRYGIEPDLRTADPWEIDEGPIKLPPAR